MEKWAKEFISWCDHHKISVPRTQGELVALEVFEAKGKNLTSIHPNIAYLKNLYRIVLDNNLLSTLPPLPRRVSAISLSHNLFREIPQSLKPLKNLHTLIISHNGVESLPEWFEGFKTMHLLDITDNKIGSLQNLCKNTELKILLVSDNKIKDISPIYELTELKFFDFSDNKVSRFDKRIRNLKKLKFFSGLDNKITDFDMLFLLEDKKVYLQLSQNSKLRATRFLRYLSKKFHIKIA